jgi:signal transduction histidine kinase
MTELFIVAIASVVCAAVTGVCQFRLRQLNRELKELETLARRLLQSQEAERKRITSEIHDGLCQNLLIINSRAALGLGSETDPVGVSLQLREISKVCQIAIQEARQIAHELGPPHLESTGLTEALEVMMDRVADSTGLKLERKLESVDELFSSESGSSFFRIVQEALNNVMKHADAASASVELIRDVSHIQLVVQDNGRGFKSAAGNAGRRGRGSGLSGIAERVRILQGTLSIESDAGSGTRLTVRIPIQDGAKM